MYHERISTRFKRHVWRIAAEVNQYTNRSLLALLIAAAVADLVSTYLSLMHEATMHLNIELTREIAGYPVYFAGDVIIGKSEGNPVMAWLIADAGYIDVAAFKFAAVALIVLLPLCGGQRKRTFAAGAVLTSVLWLTASTINILPIITS